VFKQTVDAGHVKELALYRDEVGRANDPQLRALAETRVETLEKALGKGPSASEAMHRE
jgi:hypothetical protein